ncbi:MAG: RidA family protein [Alphaproteobacteria bacterium]
MTSKIDARLAALGITIPDLAPPVANYVPFTISGKTLYISGQLPGAGGQMTKGHLGKDVSLEDGQKAARVCAINIVAQAKAALGDLDKISRCLRLGGFVASTPEFTDHPKVVNGASDLIVEVFGDAGKHARAAVGVSALPLGAAVEVDAIFEIK